ncbi:recombinase family protein [Nonomuraea sp. NPDC050786]|uniref:recombinase family protein n=1 Tax=Nonomuraea sp. NPDC050786 TaxID=3154840 RepID=UPI0033D9C36C
MFDFTIMADDLRAARSLRHLLDLPAQFREREVDLLVLKQGIDTSPPSGRLQFQPRRRASTGPGRPRRGDGPRAVRNEGR